jgi:hypothetical protein
MSPDQESFNVATPAENLKLRQSNLVSEPQQDTLLQRLVDAGAVYVPQALTPPQFQTLRALLDRLITYPHQHVPARLDADLAGGSSASLAPRSSELPLALDALDTIARTHTRYSFADLTPEIQDVIIDFIASGRLTVKYLNLALWLEDLRAAASSAIAA